MRHNRSFDTYTPEELRKISKKAGIASGKARREKRSAIEREIIHDAALKEMRRENIQIIREATHLLKQAKREMRL